MDNLHAVGSLWPTQQGPSVEENTRTGFETTVQWVGTYLECYNKRLQLRASGYYSHIGFGPVGDGKYKVVGTSPYDEFGLTPGPVPSINELEVEVAQIDLQFSQKLNSLLTTKTIGGVILICDDFKTGKYADYDSDGHMTDSGWAAAITAVDACATANGDSNSTAEKLFTNVCGRGLQSALEYHTVYRRTLTAATPQQVRASYVGAGQIWTTGEVQDFEGISPFDWFQLPANQQFLKTPPSVTGTARQKTQLTYSYTQCKQATALLYDAYGAAVLLDA
jgi:hypothetical protein